MLHLIPNHLDLPHPTPLPSPNTLHCTLSQEKRARGEPTVPSTIAEVFQINPFMRVNEEAVKRHAGTSDPVEVMQFLRDGKDKFKPKS